MKFFFLINFFPAKVQALKRSVPKGDKKKKKDIAAEIALLEAQLEEKHNKENNEHDQNCKKVSESIMSEYQKE